MVTGLLNTGDGETSNILLDLLGFDGWPACYAMQQVAAGEPEKNGLVFCCFGVLCLGCSIEFVWKISVWEVGSLHF